MGLPVFKALGATFAFIAQHLATILRILWAPLALNVVGSALVAPQYLSAMIEVQSFGPTANPDEVLAATSRGIVPGLAMLAIGLVSNLLMSAGLLKFVIRNEAPSGPFYMALGRDEWRLFLTGLLAALAAIGVYLCGILALVLIGGLGAALGAAGGVLVTIAGTVLLVVMIWLGLRLSLAAPASIARQRIGVQASYDATKGKVWSLLGYFVLIGLIFVVAELLLVGFVLPGYFDAIAASGEGLTPGQPLSPEAAQALQAKLNEIVLRAYDLKSPQGYVTMVVNFIGGGALITVGMVALGVAWRLITERPEAAPAEV